MTYKEQLLDPRWQRRRLHILERDKFTCQICLDTETTLHVHHTEYDDSYETLAWEYPDHVYKTLCSFCHKHLTEYKKETGTEVGFDVFRIKTIGNLDTMFVYENGLLKVYPKGSEDFYGFSEYTIKKLVHFTINNWLKNG